MQVPSPDIRIDHGPKKAVSLFWFHKAFSLLRTVTFSWIDNRVIKVANNNITVKNHRNIRNMLYVVNNGTYKGYLNVV